MFRFPKLLILLVASSDIPVVALPAPTRVASSAASIFMGRAGVIPLSTAIANESHPVLSISELGTRSRQSEQSEDQQQQTADPAPCDMFTGVLGPTDDANVTLDATTTGAETITRGTPPSSIVAVTPGPSSQPGLWSSSKFAAEPTNTVKTASSRITAAVTSDATTSAETITPGSSSSAVAAESTTVRLTIMISSMVGADPTTETLSVSLPSSDTSSTTTPISSFPVAATMTMKTTTESADVECLDERALETVPKSKGGGSRCQIASSSAGTSGLAWWKMVPIPPALLLWIGGTFGSIMSIYVFGKMVLRCIPCRSRPRDSTDLACETVQHGPSQHGVGCSFWWVSHGD